MKIFDEEVHEQRQSITTLIPQGKKEWQKKWPTFNPVSWEGSVFYLTNIALQVWRDSRDEMVHLLLQCHVYLDWMSSFLGCLSSQQHLNQTLKLVVEKRVTKWYMYAAHNHSCCSPGSVAFVEITQFSIKPWQKFQDLVLGSEFSVPQA